MALILFGLLDELKFNFKLNPHLAALAEHLIVRKYLAVRSHDAACDVVRDLDVSPAHRVAWKVAIDNLHGSPPRSNRVGIGGNGEVVRSI